MFFAVVLTGLVLLFISGDLLWDLEAKVIYPADLWLLAVSGLLLWGLSEMAPAHLRRDWYEWPLAGCVVLGVIFAFITTLEALDTGPTPAALLVAVVGGVPFPWPQGGVGDVCLVSCSAASSVGGRPPMAGAR